MAAARIESESLLTMRRLVFLILTFSLACRTHDTPESIPECDEYVAASRTCAHGWLKDVNDPVIAATERNLTTRAKDAGADDREHLRALCRRAAERTRQRCGGDQ